MKLIPLVTACLVVMPVLAMAQTRTNDQRQTPPELWTNVENYKLELSANASRVTGNVDSSSFGGDLRYALKMNQRNSL